MDVRPRRMRRDDFSRRLMRESSLSVDQLVLPLFVHEPAGRAPVASMPDATNKGSRTWG